MTDASGALDEVDSAQVAAPEPTLRMVTAALRDCPLIEGTAPKLTLTGLSTALALTAASRSSRPAPAMLTFVSFTSVGAAAVGKRFSTPRAAVFTIAERTSAADQSGFNPRITAADPARCGVAIDVPWNIAKHGGSAQALAGTDEMTFTPGATTSGFTRKSTSVGPWL